jgi:TatD DNase family protein
MQSKSAWLSPAEADRRRSASKPQKPDCWPTSTSSQVTLDQPPRETQEISEVHHKFLIDVGVNLAHKRFSHDISEVIQRAIANKVAKMVVTGTSIATSRRAIEVAKLAPNVLFTTAGVHPHDAKTWTTQSAAAIRNLVARNPGTVKAIGECGLDFDRNFSTPEQQILAFRAQLELACELNLPVFLHERSAFDTFIEIIKQYRPRLCAAVVHCFTGTKRELEQYLELDLHIGITGWVCDDRRGQDLLRITPLIPLDRLMIET